MAKLIYSRVNVLVLDEPTNHLDIPSREALEEALSAYEGTIITISHDRYFLDRVATQILSLDGLGGAEHYDGDYTEYHDWKLGGSLREDVPRLGLENLVSMSPAGSSIEDPPPVESVSKAKATTKPAPKKQGIKVIKNKKSASRTTELIENDIAAAEKLLSSISEQMGTPIVARDAVRLRSLNSEYQQTENRLRELYEEWDRGSQESPNA